MTFVCSARGISSSALAQGLSTRLEGREPALVLVFSSPAHPLAEVAGTLAARFPSACVLGASSAGEFTETGESKQSIAAVAIAGEYRVFGGFGRGLKADLEGTVARALEGLPRMAEGHPHCTAILLLDPLSGVGEEASLLVAAHLGPEVQLAGGAAGDDLAMTRTEVASGNDSGSDALAIALVYSKKPLAIGVSHGHQPISGKLLVTSAEGNIVHTIDGRPAWDVWREQTREVAKTRGLDADKLAPSEIGAYLLRYEAGLALGGDPTSESAKFKIRAPLAVLPDGSLSFATGIPEGTTIRITESVAERQVEAAIRAASNAKKRLGSEECAGAVVFDCICRKLILDSEFEDAVKGMSKELGEANLAGFETYGEIALNQGEMSGFHNTTSVVLAFPR